MKSISLPKRKPSEKANFWMTLVTILIIFMMTSCSLLTGDEEDEDLHRTETALAREQTRVAEQASGGLQATVDALQATVNAQSVQETLNAQQATLSSQAVQETKAATPPPEQPTSPPPAPATQAAPADLEARIRNASVLLYESTSGGGDAARIAKFALQEMGITNVVDVGDAIGRLKSNMQSLGPTGTGWDLIFIDAEGKDTFSGEFFQYTMDQLNRGSSIVLTIWYLNYIYGGMASSVLDRCGVYISGDWNEIPVAAQIMYPLNTTHPIMTTPNSGLMFNQPTGIWGNWDVGDLVSLSGTGDAQILYGTDPQNKTGNGLVTICINDQLVLQTFASHIFPWDNMKKLFQNYAYNLLKARFSRVQ